MKITPKLKYLILAIVIIGCCFAPLAAADYKRINKPDVDDPMAVAAFRLKNGLRVYLTENHEAPHFYAEVAVRVGSKYDPADNTGLAHYLEHLLFKGTPHFGTVDYEKEKPHLERIAALYEKHFYETDAVKRKEIYVAINAESQKAGVYAIPNELGRMYKIMGGSWLNAHTSFEEIVYKVKLPSNRLRQWAKIESERFKNPVYRLFHTELETVYEEKNRLLDDKYWIIREAVLKKLFKRHPYGQQSIIGSVEHLKNPSLQSLYNYYDTYYLPNNMAIFISGAINIDETIQIIDDFFSSWKTKRLPRIKKWKEKALKGIQRVEVNYQGEEYVLLAFRTARYKHRDFEDLLLFDKLLGDPEVGLINLNLNLTQKVRAAGSYARMYNDYGIQFLWGIPKQDQGLEEVERLLLEQVELIKTGVFQKRLLADMVTNLKIGFKKQLESNAARVSLMRDAFLSFVPWKHSFGLLKRLEKVTKKNIIRVAKKYFRNNYVAGFRRDKQHDVPSIEKPDIKPIPIVPTRQSEFMTEVLAMPTQDIEPVFVDPESDYKVIQDANGLRYYYVNNPINDIFTLTIAVDIGVRQDNRLKPASRFLMKSGTESLSPEELKRQWYSLGSTFNIHVKQNETIISVTGLDENFDASVALLAQILLKPQSDKQTLSEFKKIIRIQRQDMKKNHHSIMEAVREYNLYAKESMFLNMLPIGDLEEMSVNQLHTITKNLLGYKRAITYVGALTFDDVQKILKQHLSTKARLQDPPVYRQRRLRAPKHTEIYFFDKQMAQTHILVEFAGEQYNEQNKPVGQLYNYYFAGGMSGIVFQELRESRALAYSVWAGYAWADRKKEQNIMRAGIETQSDKTNEAVEIMLDLIDSLPYSSKQFLEARDSIVNRYRSSKIRFRNVIDTVRAWERLGLLPDPRRERFNKIKIITMDQLRQFHDKEIAHQPKLISIVGDRNKIDMQRLGKLGRIVYVALDDILVD